MRVAHTILLVLFHLPIWVGIAIGVGHLLSVKPHHVYQPFFELLAAMLSPVTTSFPARMQSEIVTVVIVLWAAASLMVALRRIFGR